MTSAPRRLAALLITAAQQWRADHASRLAAALAYYAIFSMAPVAIFAVAIAGAVFGPPTARARLVDLVTQWISPGAGEFVAEMIGHTVLYGSGGWATAFGVAILAYGAASIFSQAKFALNTVWRVSPKVGGVRGFLHSRLIGFAFTVLAGMLLVLSLVAGTAMKLSAAVVGDRLPRWLGLLHAGDFVLSFALVAVAFAVAYRVLPDTATAWSDVWLGAVIAAALVAIVTSLFGTVVAATGLRSAYGAAGSIVILLVWVNITAQIFLFGAEVSQVYALRHGSLRRVAGADVTRQRARAATDRD